MFKDFYFRYSTSRETISLFYWHNAKEKLGNAGDLLSEYVVQKLSTKQVRDCSRKNPFKFVAIGSLICDGNVKFGGVFWGTGMHDTSVRKFLAPCIFTAVRGPLTRQSLLDAGYQCPEIYGDPALLMPMLYEKTPTKKYRLGIICHYLHRDKVKVADDVLFIDIMRKKGKGLEELIDEICQCEAILSSSLHGIILANAYGIPARYFVFEGVPLYGAPSKKFNDYFLSVGMPCQTPMVIKADTLITVNTCRDMDRVVDLKIDLRKLQEAFPFA